MKGRTNNPNGRPVGTPNKITRELRAKLKNLIDAELEALPGLMDGLNTVDRLDVFIKLLPFALPKVEPISSTAHEPFAIGDMFE